MMTSRVTNMVQSNRQLGHTKQLWCALLNESQQILHGKVQLSASFCICKFGLDMYVQAYMVGDIFFLWMHHCCLGSLSSLAGWLQLAWKLVSAEELQPVQTRWVLPKCPRNSFQYIRTWQKLSRIWFHPSCLEVCVHLGWIRTCAPSHFSQLVHLGLVLGLENNPWRCREIYLCPPCIGALE